MFLSLVPQHHHHHRQRDPWFIRRPFTIFDESEEEDDEFLDELNDILTTPLTFTVCQPSRKSIPSHHRRHTLKRKNQDASVAIIESAGKSDVTPANKKGRFEVTMDVDGFKPNELNVKLVDDCLVIEGKQEHKDENGMTSRHFMRKCTIPQNVNIEELKCDLNDQGRMVISGPRIIEEEQTKERFIPITLTHEKEKIAVEESNNEKLSHDAATIKTSEMSSDKSEENANKSSESIAASK